MATNWGQYVKCIAKIQGKDILPEIKMPRKPRAKEMKPRKAYDREEDRLRPLIIDELRRKGYEVWRIENSISGRRNSSIPDLWFFNQHRRTGGWIEVKTPTGRIEIGQLRFQNLCRDCGVNHFVIRSLEELNDIFK